MYEASEIISQNRDWISLLFLYTLILLGFLRYIYGDRLLYTSTFFFSKQYIVILFSQEKNKIFNFFQFLCIQLQIIVFSMLYYLYSSTYGIFNDSGGDALLYFGEIALVIGLYLLGRYFLGRLLSWMFDLGKLQQKIAYEKLSYFNNTILWILPMVLACFYIQNHLELIVKGTLIFFGILMILRYVLLLSTNKNLILSNLFYFILYLCTLEIAPLVFILKTTN